MPDSSENESPPSGERRALLLGLFVSNFLVGPISRAAGEIVGEQFHAPNVGAGIARWGPTCYRALLFFYNAQHLERHMDARAEQGLERRIADVERRLARVESNKSTLG